MESYANPLVGRRVWKVGDLNREQLLFALKLTDSHHIIEGEDGSNALIIADIDSFVAAIETDAK